MYRLDVPKGWLVLRLIWGLFAWAGATLKLRANCPQNES